MRALISVSDKKGIVEFAGELENLGVEIISTGGTHKTLKEAGIKVKGISEITKFPECLDGRVKTLHPNIHAGILARRDKPDHMKELSDLNIQTTDLVVVNLYPFKETILKEGVTREEAIENIDIGGPTMLRAAAKNYRDVAVIVDPEDYERVIGELREKKEVSLDTKFYLCSKAFSHTAHYDALISSYMKREREDTCLPHTFTMTFEKVQEMRYGENPHQKAAFYKEIGNTKGLLTSAIQLHGKELSFNNINDTNGALELLKEFPASPKSFLSMMLLIASSASFLLSQIKTPLPAAKPSAFTTIGVLNLSRSPMAFSELVYTSYRAEGIEYFFIKSLEYDLLPSNLAPAFRGPKAFIPFSLSISTKPATKGASGPTTTISILESRENLTNLFRSSAFMSRHSAICDMPAFPGAQ
jgi:hypothetical protein